VITGEDTLRADRKFKKPFDFISYATAIFLLNVVPRTNDKTVGYYPRFYPIYFNANFEGKENRTICEDLNQEDFTAFLSYLLETVLPRIKKPSLCVQIKGRLFGKNVHPIGVMCNCVRKIYLFLK